MSGTPFGKEKRAYKRIVVNLQARYRPLRARKLLSNKYLEAIVVDLSEWGLSLLTERGMPPGTILTIGFTLIDSKAGKEERIIPIKVQGEVAYNLPLKGKDHRLGIRLINVDFKEISAIKRYITHISG